ncbi:MAG: Abi family protein [Burkholderiaceae bacterium]|nr:Abi family protein [Burkholderiaceae bacterium]
MPKRPAGTPAIRRFAASSSETPIWAAAELATFGNLSMLIQNLVHKEDRQAIARFFYVDQSVFCNSLHHFTVLRNFTAHHARIWNREFPITLQFPKTYKNHEINPILFNKRSSGVNRIYNSVRMLDYLLGQIDSSLNLFELFKDLLLKYPHIPRLMLGVPIGLKL